MATGVEVSTQSWGQIVDGSNHPLVGLVPTLEDLEGNPVTIYADEELTTPLGGAWVSDVDGLLPGFVAVDTYQFTEPLDLTVREVQAVSGALLRSVESGHAELVGASPINVKLSYGAIGDGESHPLSEVFGSLVAAQLMYPHAVALTDEIDTVAHLAALDASEGSGRPLLSPKGTYIVNDPDGDERCLPIFDDITWYGDGLGRTTFMLRNDTNAVIVGARRDGSDYDTFERVVLRDLTLDGDAMNSTIAAADSGNPLFFSFGARVVKVYRCDFRNGRSYGPGFQSYPTQLNLTARAPNEDHYWESCRFYWNGFRKTGDSTTLAEDLDATETTISLTSAAAFASSGAILLPSGEKVKYTGKSGNDLTGCTRGAYATTAAVQANGGTVHELSLHDDGIDYKSSERLTWNGCDAFGNADAGFDARARSLSATGCHAWANNNNGFDISIAAPALDTTLAEDLDASETTITLTSATAFVSPGQVIVGTEKITFTGISGNDLTGCTRGAFSSVAATHTTGDRVFELLPTGLLPRLDGHATLTGCTSWGNGTGGFCPQAPDIDRIAYVTLNGCFAWENGGQGVDADATAGGELHVSINGGAYNYNAVDGIGFGACTEANATGVDCKGNAQYGIQISNMPNGAGVANCSITGNDRGIRSTGTSDRCRIMNNRLRDNTTSDMTLVGTLNRAADNDSDLSIPSIASAATVAPSQTRDTMQISGTADITSLGAIAKDRTITLIFTGTAATNGLVDGSNLRLNGNLAYTPNDAITLFYDGSNYYERGRSAN